MTFQFFMLESELEDWLARFAKSCPVHVFLQEHGEAPRPVRIDELSQRRAPRQKLLLLVAKQSEREVWLPGRSPLDCDSVRIVAPLESTGILEPGAREHVERMLCGCEGACLLMGQVVHRKDSDGVFPRKVVTSLRRFARGRADCSRVGSSHVQPARGVRCSEGALRWHAEGGHLRQTSVKNVQYIPVPADPVRRSG